MKKDNTLLELLSGIIFLGGVIQVICFIVSKDYLYNAIGLWSGIAVACFMAIHIKRSIEDTLDMGEEGAVKHARIAYVTRMLVTAVVLGIIIYYDIGNPIMLIIGMVPLKISAYLHPYIHKLFVYFQKFGDS